jgi:hypothetical protein
MFVASSNRIEQNQDTEEPTSSSWISFARDLGASVLTIGALGVLLVAIHGHSAMPESKVKRTSAAASQMTSARELPRQPRDEAAVPNAEEERIAKAAIAFALSKVAAPREEPMVSLPVPTLPPISGVTAAAPRKPAKAQASLRNPPARIPIGAGQSGFTQAEWPQGLQTYPRTVSATPKDQARLVAMTRYVPGPNAIIGSAQNIAGTAKKTVGYGVDGLRTGVSAVQEKALALAGRLW